MKSNYRRLGDFIQKVDVRNKSSQNNNLLGLSMTKEFRKSTSNIVGTDLSVYKVVDHWQFACDFMSTIRVRKLPVVLQNENEKIIVSPAYTVFEVLDTNKLNPEYLMMWFRRSEFDRYAYFCCDSAVRGGFNWEELCDVELPLPWIEKQREIVKEYNTIVNRITLNEQLNQKLEETAQALYKEWFVDFEFPNENEQPYKSSGGKMVYNEELDQDIPDGWNNGVFDDFATIINGYAFKSADFSEKESIPILKIKNVQPPVVSLDSSMYYKNDMSEKLNRVLVNYGDVLITMTGSGANQMNSAVGQVGKYYFKSPALLNQRVCKLIFKDRSYRQFTFLFISRKESQLELLNGSSGSANQANISPDQIRNLKVLAPPIKLLEKFEKLAIAFENSMRVVQKDTLNELKGLILSRMSMVESVQTEVI